jgi:hypothetical protein
MPEDPLPDVGALQFRRAQPIVDAAPESAKSCAACKQLIGGEYFQVQNHVICSLCAARIRAGAGTKRAIPWHRAILFGAGAAIAGCILYAIPLAMGVQIGIVALAVGYMVGKAIRHGTYGIGGRPLQILAVVLTYFAISTSFLPAMVFMVATHRVQIKSPKPASSQETPVPKARPAPSPGKAAAGLLVLAVISPFLELKSSPAGGLISLFILFIGLQRAWALTAGREIMVTGPYPCPPT